MIRIGFDIGGVLSRYPEILGPMIEALNADDRFEVHVLTDVPGPRAIDLIHKNGLSVPEDRIHSCDRAQHGDACKAAKIRELGIQLMIDDHLPYLGEVSGCARLHVLPDERPFFAPGFDECRR